MNGATQGGASAASDPSSEVAVDDPAPPAAGSPEDELVQPAGLLRACLLLLLGERAGHGYDLHERLRPFGFDRTDPSRSYRALHWLERADLIEAHWETAGPGPARRVYQLTPRGTAALERSVHSLHQRNRALARHLARYRRQRRA